MSSVDEPLLPVVSGTTPSRRFPPRVCTAVVASLATVALVVSSVAIVLVFVHHPEKSTHSSGQSDITGDMMAEYLGTSPISIECDTTGDTAIKSYLSERKSSVALRCGSCLNASRLVWGTDVYTSDSLVCSAAVHAGVFSLEHGGILLLTREAGSDMYHGSTRNGVTSQDHGAHPLSFKAGSTLLNDVNALSKRLSSVEGAGQKTADNLASMDTRVQGLGSGLDSLKGGLADVVSHVSDLDSNLSGLGAKLKSAGDELQDESKRVNELQQKLSSQNVVPCECDWVLPEIEDFGNIPWEKNRDPANRPIRYKCPENKVMAQFNSRLDNQSIGGPMYAFHDSGDPAAAAICCKLCVR